MAMALTLSGLAVAFALGSAILSLGAVKDGRVIRILATPLLGVAGVSALAAGVVALLTGEVATATVPLGLPWLPWQIRLDALSGFFMMIIGILISVVGIHAPSYLRGIEQGRGEALAALGGFTGLFLTGMLLVVLAADAFLFMIAWELMSLASYFLVAFQHEHAANRRAAFLYLLMAHVGGLAILLGFGVLAAFGEGFSFAAMRAAELSALWASLASDLHSLDSG